MDLLTYLLLTDGPKNEKSSSVLSGD